MKEQKWKILLMISLAFGVEIPAQNRVIDSLKLSLKSARHDTTRVKILSELTEICEIEDMPVYAEPCIKLAEVNAAAANDKNLKNFYLKELANALNSIGYLAKKQGDISKGLTYYNKSLKIQEGIQDKRGIATTLNNLASIYENQGNIPKALEYNHRSLKIREEIDDKKGIAASFNNIGVIYVNQQDYSTALGYYQKSLAIREKINDKLGISYSLNNIGFIYDKQGDYSRALSYYHKSLLIKEEIHDISGIAGSLLNIGFIQMKQGEGLMALENYRKSLKLREELKDKEGIAFTLNDMAEAMLQQGMLASALSCANQGLQISRQLGFPYRIRQSAATLKTIYKKQGKYKDAFVMYQLEIYMQDSINNDETRKASIKKQLQYVYEKQAAADSVKNAEEQNVKNAQLKAQQAQLRQEKTQRYALYGGLGLIIVFSVFVFNRYKLTQKQKIIIEQQKETVDTAYEKLHEKNKEVMDSIFYARRIQRSLITSEKYIAGQLKRLARNN